MKLKDSKTKVKKKRPTVVSKTIKQCLKQTIVPVFYLKTHKKLQI